jgi:DNA-binding NarL/FixJ family response regulator
MQMTQARVVVADDHAILLEGLSRILKQDFDLVASVMDGKALVEVVADLKPDVAVADISMPMLNGIDALRQARLAGSRTKFVFLTGSGDVWLATQALKMGAHGYVLKQSASDELIHAIRAALEGQTYISPRIASQVMQSILNHPHSEQGPALTVREREVLQLLAEGRTLKETAAILNVSPRTIEFHRSNLADKTGFHTTAELTRYALRSGMVQTGS